MQKKPMKLEIIGYHPTYVKVKLLDNKTNQEIKMSKQFFRKRLDYGLYEIVNKQKIPTVI